MDARSPAADHMVTPSRLGRSCGHAGVAPRTVGFPRIACVISFTAVDPPAAHQDLCAYEDGRERVVTRPACSRSVIVAVSVFSAHGTQRGAWGYASG